MKYYYVRDGKNRPMITVAVEPDGNGGVNRGVAICSDKDNPSKQLGKIIAAGRLECYKRRNRVEQIITWMAGVNLPPTDFEKRMLGLNI